MNINGSGEVVDLDDRLIVGVDYDKAYVENPKLFNLIIPLIQAQDARVFLITTQGTSSAAFRSTNKRLRTSSVVTGGLQKANAINCDIWIDSFPSSIPTTLELRGMLTGCLANGED